MSKPRADSGPEYKAIRLRATVRAGNKLFPNNAVIDAPSAVADRLVADGRAEETDAVERYPVPFPGFVSDDFPVSGAEKFPPPEGIDPVVSSALIGTEADTRAAAEAQAAVGPVYDHPEKVGDESSPAKAGEPAKAEPDEPEAAPPRRSHHKKD